MAEGTPYTPSHESLRKNRKEECLAKQKDGIGLWMFWHNNYLKIYILAGDKTSIADISLYAYTHRAHEGGFWLAAYPNIKRLLKLIEQMPN